MKGLEINEVSLSEIKQNNFTIIGSDFNSKTKSINLDYLKNKSDSIITDYFDICNKTITNKDIVNQVISYDLTNSIGNFLKDGEIVGSIDSNKKTVVEGDFIISRLRSYLKEFAIVQKQDLQQVVSTEYLVYRAKTKYLSVNMLMAYCLSSRVQSILSLSQYGSEHPRFYEFVFNSLPIPKILLNINKEIDDVFTKMFLYLDESKKFYKQAENILNKQLGFDNLEIQNEAVSIRNFSQYQKTNRFDAEYYQTKYDNIKKLLNTNDNIETICKLYDKNYKSIKNQKYQYIELANVDMTGDILGVEEIESENLPSRAKRLVKKGQVIVSSIEGSLSSCAMITEEYDNAICSNGFYVVDSNEINSETLLVLFKSQPIQELLKQGCSGTILTAISKDAFISIPIPKIDTKIQSKIAEKIQESFKLRKKAKDLLNLAKQIVETAIEKDESEALKLINNHASEKDEYMNNYNKDLPIAAEDMDEFKSKN